MRTVLEKNQLGSWYGWEIEHIGPVADASILNAAHGFYETCKKGSVKVSHGNEESAEKTPF